MLVVVDTESEEFRNAVASAVEGTMRKLGLVKTDIDTVSTKEALELLGGVSKSTLNTYHKEGLPYTPGKPNKYSRKDIEAFLSSKKTKRALI